MIMLLGGVFGLLVLGTVIGQALKLKVKGERLTAVVGNLNARMFSWWIMCVVFVVAVSLKGIGTVVLFGFVSLLALREYITLTPTRRGDHHTLFVAFFLFTPFQYYLVATKWYGLFSIFIPVYAFIFVPIRNVIAGDTVSFLARMARIQWGLMVCVYFVSHVPALLMLEIPGYEGENAKLLFFFVLTVQLCDVLQYVWGNLIGKRKITPTVSPGKTWGGFLGGVACTTALGAGLHWVTPFNVWQSALMALVIAVMGFFGDLTMSAVKRDLGVKDYGQLIPGHGGMMDRIDSICFAAPVFFHLTRYFFT